MATLFKKQALDVVVNKFDSLLSKSLLKYFPRN